MIQINSISYSVGQQTILQSATFSIDTSCKLALLGDNGAGKSTFFDLLVSLIKPSTGSILFDGKPFNKVKSQVGYCRNQFDSFSRLKVRELIHYMATLHGKTDYASEYEVLNIRSIESKFMRQLSLGERKRVNILVSIMHQPQYLFLDETTSDIDTATKRDIWEKVLLKPDRTVIFATHQWEDAERYAQKVVFLKKGTFLCPPSTKNELITRFGIERKVAIHQSILISGVPSFRYNKNDMVYYFLPQDDEASLQNIQRQTNNFTILPLNLEDLYRLTIEKEAL